MARDPIALMTDTSTNTSFLTDTFINPSQVRQLHSRANHDTYLSTLAMGSLTPQQGEIQVSDYSLTLSSDIWLHLHTV